MCLITVAWKVRADLPLVVAANRDEWRDRPTEPARWWDDHPQLLAGRDRGAACGAGPFLAAPSLFGDLSSFGLTLGTAGALGSAGAASVTTATADPGCNIFDAHVPRGGRGRTFGVREATKIVFEFQMPFLARTLA